MNQQMQAPSVVQWPYFRLGATRGDTTDDTGQDADENHEVDPTEAGLDAETSASTVSKVVINGRVVLQNNVLQSTMAAMVRRAVAQQAPAILN
jgi:hypothetical protein